MQECHFVYTGTMIRTNSLHKDYDKFINVEHSDRPNMNVRFPKKIEPGIIKFYDVNIIKSKEKEASDQHTPLEVRMITQKGDEF